MSEIPLGNVKKKQYMSHILLREESDLITEEEIKQVDEGCWVYEFDNEINKMKRYIPNLGLHDYDAVPINISVREEELPI
jgi:hypothetical protein